MSVSVTQVGAVEIKITDNIDKWEELTIQNNKSAQRAMCDSILNLSRMITPMSANPKTMGNLRRSGEVVAKDENTMAVRYGSNIAPYARYQEFGKPTWHYTTPGTGPHFLQRSGDAVIKRGIEEYLR